MKLKFINGNWIDDDVDITPTIKLRVGSKINTETNLKVKGISIALCWLKWGVMVSFGKVKIYTKIELDKNERPIIY